MLTVSGRALLRESGVVDGGNMIEFRMLFLAAMYKNSLTQANTSISSLKKLLAAGIPLEGHR